MADPQNKQRDILDLLLTKGGMKQDVYARLQEVFLAMKAVLEELAGGLEKQLLERDPRVTVRFRDKGQMACELQAAGDVVIFHMHTNVFLLDQSHSLWRSSYLEEDATRGYFGVVNMYNFLNDSFKFNRMQDLGYLVARLLVNREGHFLVQGKRQLGFLFNDLAGSVLDRPAMEEVLHQVLLHVIDFDLLAPPYDHVSQVTVQEMNHLNDNLSLRTGKRMGFRFHDEEEGPQA